MGAEREGIPALVSYTPSACSTNGVSLWEAVPPTKCNVQKSPFHCVHTSKWCNTLLSYIYDVFIRLLYIHSALRGCHWIFITNATPSSNVSHVETHSSHIAFPGGSPGAGSTVSYKGDIWPGLSQWTLGISWSQWLVYGQGCYPSEANHRQRHLILGISIRAA